MMKTGRKALTVIFMLLACAVAQAQDRANDSETERVRQAIRSYLETTQNNLNTDNPVASTVVHPQAKIFSRVGNELVITNISKKPAQRRANSIKLESIDRIVSVDVTGSMAVAKIETVYPYGSLTAAEYKSLPENDPVRVSTGKRIELASYLSLLKTGGEWKIVSFLIAPDVAGNR